ncbi:Crp/Fnr family transcriptional regulator [Methylobacterium sp. J-068]|uniref:Crp/Fnr family transcriptional regulator n=1 Tax=Methylobacterium sp. J-068 TaxID=2836649 RepID=UPI001FB9E6EC|nr:Crp/Fnr family transcriptional regulator [Methylobacterium sp. J-068]MCJ2035055.1 Crp/Fnr family transcriptional regulator [Methylobacterium sp. J-068]
MVSGDEDFLAVHDAEETGNDQGPIANNIRALRPGDIVITHGLASRPAKPAAIAAEADALHAISGGLARDPAGAAEALLAALLRLCACGSVGFSLAETGPGRGTSLRWSRVVGPLARQVGTVLPRDAGPCGLCLDANATILVSRPFSILAQAGQVDAPLLEGLFAPLRDTGGAHLGTLWAVHHDPTRRFDAEDARVLEQMAPLLVLALKARPEALQVPATTQVRATRPVAEVDENPFVRKLHGFVPLSGADRARLHRLTLDAIAVPARTDLIREGDAPGGVFLMMEGTACRYRAIGGGRRQITAFLLPGDFCDLDVALLSRMDHTIMTSTASRVARLDRATVLDLTQNHPNIAAALRKTTLVDEATLREWLVNLGSRSALERVASLFCELQARCDVVGLSSADSDALPITLEDLAHATGLSSVHVNRTLWELRRLKLIAPLDGRFGVTDLQGLRDLTGFTGEYLHLEDRRPRA